MASSKAPDATSENIVWHEHKVTAEKRARLKQQRAAVLWFTGLSGSGKSTIANALEERLFANANHTYLLDGDNIRLGLNQGLGFSEEDRNENLRRIGEVCKLFVDAGILVLSAFVSPYRRNRDAIRSKLNDGEFIEVFIDTPIEVCEQRDPKGLYKKARKGEISDFTGISSPYEAPLKPEIHIQTAECSVEQAVEQIVEYLKKHHYIN